MFLAKVKGYLSRFSTNEKLVRNLLWLVGDKILRYAISLVVVVWTARYLGPENNGVLSYALAFTSFFGALVSFGMSTIGVTDLSKQPEREHSILGTATAIMSAGVVVSIVLQTILISQIRPGDTLMHTLVLIIGISYLVRPLHSAVSIFYQAKPDYKPIVITSNIAFITVSLLKVVALIYSKDLNTLAAITAFEIVLLCILLTVHYQRTTSGVRLWKVERGLFFEYLKQGFPLFLSGLATDLYMRIDLVMVGDLHSNREAGIYAVAVNMVQIWYFLPVIVYNSVFPDIVRLYGQDIAQFRKKMQKWYNSMALLTYALCLPVTFFAPYIITLLFGEDYRESGYILSMLIWGAAFVNLGVPRNAYIYSYGYYRLQFEINMTSCVLNILLNFLLIPSYGAFGATAATLISYSYASFFSNFVYRRIRENGWMMLKAIYNPLGATR